MRPAARRLMSAAAVLGLAVALTGCVEKTFGPLEEEGLPSAESSDPGAFGEGDGAPGSGSPTGAWALTTLQTPADCQRIASAFGFDQAQATMTDITVLHRALPEQQYRFGATSSTRACHWPHALGDTAVTAHLGEYQDGPYPTAEAFAQVQDIADGQPTGTVSPFTSESDESGTYAWGAGTADGEPFGVCAFAQDSFELTLLLEGERTAERVATCPGLLRLVERLRA